MKISENKLRKAFSKIGIKRSGFKRDCNIVGTKAVSTKTICSGAVGTKSICSGVISK